MEEMENSSVVLPSPIAVIMENTSMILENGTNLQEVRRIFSICDVKEFKQSNLLQVSDSSENIDLGDLVPTIAQIFLTISLGWLAGTFKVIGPQEARGLNIFIGKYSMPSLVFISLATLDFSTINVAFLLGIFISKFCLFFVVMLLIRFSFRDISTAAMFAMFCTQTNDFAMGLPLLTAVLGRGHHLSLNCVTQILRRRKWR